LHLIPRRGFLAGLTGLATHAVGGKAAALSTQDTASVLLVGVSEYDTLPVLPSAVRDAALMKVVFASLGFKTTMLINPTRDEFLYGLARFTHQSKSSSLMIAYAAAHGAMIGGQNHIFFKDSQTVEHRVPETVLLQAMNGQPRQKVLFLDTCRNSPLPNIQGQIDTSQYHAGTYVSYAAQPGAPAIDGKNGHSPYAKALQAALKTPNQTLSELSRRVRLDVLQETNGLQIPWERSSLLLPIILNP